MSNHPVFEKSDLLIHTEDRRLGEELFPEDGQASPEGGLEFEYNGMYIRKDGISPSSVMVLVDAGRDVALGVGSAWLYDKLKDKDVSIETAKGSYDATKEGIEEALEDVIEQE